MTARPRAWLGGTLVLACAAGAALVHDGRRDPARDAAAAAWSAAGGPGLGSAASPDRCAHAFDPRLDDGCALDTGAAPGTSWACVHGPTAGPPPGDAR